MRGEASTAGALARGEALVKLKSEMAPIFNK